MLTLAVVDDLTALVIIALFYTSNFHAWYLIASIIPIGLYFWLTHKHEKLFHDHTWAAWVILFPLGLLTWSLFLESGIHATITGVILGFCVPVFAFFSAGVAVGDWEDLRTALTDSVAIGIMVGLVVGKTIGITRTT